MDALTTCSGAGGRFLLPFHRSPSSNPKNRSSSFRRSNFFPVLASRDGPPELNQWDQMELKFGSLLGEDPKLTLAKVMGKKSNPDASYLDIEKSFFRKKKSKTDDEEENIDQQPSTASSDRFRVSIHKKNAPRVNELNLLRPSMIKGMGVRRPVENPETPIVAQSSQLPGEHDGSKGGKSPSFMLRKPKPLQEDDIESENNTSKLEIKPNLYLKMRKGPSKSPTDGILLKKPQVMFSNPSDQESALTLAELQQSNFGGSATRGSIDMADGRVSLVVESPKSEGVLKIGLQPPKQRGIGTREKEAALPYPLDLNSVQYHDNLSTEASLQVKPMRLDSHSVEVSHPVGAERVKLNDEGHDEAGHSLSSEQEEHEDNDWRTAEDLLQTGDRVEVELISCSNRGFVVQLGSLIGFLPYRNLGTKWKFLAFESWLRKKGLDPSLYKQNLSIVGNYEVQNKNIMLGTDGNLQMDKKVEEKLSPDMKFEDLLETYDQEKNKFLSSFVGQRTKVTVILVDRNSRRLIFSRRPKENEELVERKRSLMAKLNVGDVVKCRITKITYFGIFVEVEEVPALIHQSEVSWDATLDPSSFFKIGQIVDAKVHQLDFALERITLSLKDIMPDPLNEALESVVGEHGDFEWADVESLIKELQQIDGVIGVSKGRFFLSPGLAPTFQVYMSSMLGNQYKLLARYENKVQEVIVRASLDKEQMKAAILTCTDRVE